MKKPVVLMGALKGETSTFIENLENPIVNHWNKRTVYEGYIAGKKVIVMNSGVGKVQAAMSAQKIIDEYQPSSLFFWGIAGSLRNDLSPGDMIAGRESVQHDMDATFFRYKRGEVPDSKIRFIPGDPILYEKALNVQISGIKIAGGTIVTGDQFIIDRESPDKRYLTEDLGGDCIDMEGAAIAWVCHENKIPHLLLRTISDNADGKQNINLREFLKKASEISLDVFTQILISL